MKRFLSIFPAMLAALTLVLSPAMTAHAQGGKITIRDENEMGKKFDRILRSQMSMVGDTYITDYVDDLVVRIVKAKRPMPFQIRSATVANPLINAFAIPGGYIYIFTGLIQSATSESQLAGVIAHELAHVSQRHVASRLDKQSKVGILTTAGMLAGLFLGMVAGSPDAAAAMMIGSQSVGTAAMLQYSQEDEREADHVGMNSLVKAGYNPAGMPEMFEIMMKNRWFDSGSQMPTYLSTHPGTSERISYMQDRIQRMPPTLTERKDNNITLEHIQPLIRSKMSPANTALAYYTGKDINKYIPMDYIGRGIAQHRLKDIDGAEESYTKALELDGKDPLVAREVGIFYFKTGRHDEAFKYLQMAVIKNRRDALGLFYLARLQAEADQFDQASKNMTRVLELVPEDWEVHHHLGMILGESGDLFGGNLHLAYASAYQGNERKANHHAGVAQSHARTPEQEQQVKKVRRVIKERTKPKK